jgi:fructoselysine 3-epimerase
MKISTATSVFVNYPLPEVIDQVAALGFDGIDIWCGRPHLYRQDYSPGECNRLRKTLSDKKLTAASCMPAFYRYPYSLSSPNPEIRRDSVEYMIDCIDNASQIGSPSVLVVPSNSLRGQRVEDSREWFTRSLAEVAVHAESKNIRLGLEVVYPGLSDYLGSTVDALKIIERIGSSVFGVVLDSGHLNLSGENISQAVGRVADILLEVHVNDNDGSVQQNAIPGEGSFNFPKFLQALEKINYDDFLCLELGWNYSFDPIPAAEKALSRMRGFLNGRD